MASDAGARSHLERMLHDESVEAINLPISLLASITNDFSKEQQIGEGGFATVYMGILSTGSVAVKKLFNTLSMDDDKFTKEVSCLMRVKHKNVVRFLGYCADAQGKMLDYEGQKVIADERQRLLCFEYLPEGSLDNYINDASCQLKWRTCYKIIKEICEGLSYLHQQNIVHLDLKPANILLDHHMVPKITDFGISKCFDEKQTRAITKNLCGSMGYMAPESFDGVITFKSDIYSLGIIIIEMLTGQKRYDEIDNVLESWITRFQTSKGDKQLEPVRVIAEIAIECTNSNRSKRPDTVHILERLDEMEHKYGIFCTLSKTQDEEESMSETPSPLQRITSGVPKGLGETSTVILDVYPLELRFPFEPNKAIQCPLTLTNMTDYYIGAWITPTCQDTWSDLCIPHSKGYKSLNDPALSVFQWMEPQSTWAIAMTMKAQSVPPPRDTSMFEVVMVVMGSAGDLRKLKSLIDRKLHGKFSMGSGLLRRVEKLGGVVHWAKLKAVICEPASCEVVIGNYMTKPAPWELGDVIGVDVHPTKTWVLTNHGNKYVCIWNYQTLEREIVVQVTARSIFHFITRTVTICRICSAKFVPQEHWFIVGDEVGHVHVYSYDTTDKITEFQAYCDRRVCMLIVHPTNPFLLTGSSDGMKLWDWSQGWKCIRTFYGVPNGVTYATWNPWDNETFASNSDTGVKVWEVHSSDPITELEGTREALFSFCHRNLIVTYKQYPNDFAHIWDIKTKECIHKLGMTDQRICDIACHPTLQILVTVSGWTVCLWDADTYRIEKVIQLRDSPVHGMVFTATKDKLTRLVVGCKEEIGIMEICWSTQKTDLWTAGRN